MPSEHDIVVVVAIQNPRSDSNALANDDRLYGIVDFSADWIINFINVIMHQSNRLAAILMMRPAKMLAAFCVKINFLIRTRDGFNCLTFEGGWE